MSIYLSIDGSPPTFLASNKGWSDFARWIDDHDDPPVSLLHLCEHGWCEPVVELRKALRQAVKDVRPDDDTARVAKSLYELLNDGDVVTINDGTSPVDEPDDDQSKDASFRESDHPRADDGKFGSGGRGKPKPSANDTGHKPASSGGGEPKDAKHARSLLNKLGGMTWDKLKAAGANVAHVEHVAKEWVSSHAEANVAKLPPKLQGVVKGAWIAARLGTKAAFATYTAGQSMAERVAKERGATPEAAARLRACLSAVDMATFKPISIGLASTGLGSFVLPASMVPAGSMAYLAYSTAADPVATYRAARGVVRDVLAKRRKGEGGMDGEGLTDEMLEKLEANGEDYMVLFLAALDETGDVQEAIVIAEEAMVAKA